ncbi:MAG: zinc ribbon domain-containing protein [Anaerolineales bacterium]|nr:zinc ribbon domain-containing protein [Anaerolineales bacterium]MCB8991440.1 hypothetical protein [Ardenticatenaceae bacterium]MCB9003940.1 hypothetical protein [Ardenticatenaceae bacterium]
MPIYTYKCNDCEYQFEQRQKMSDDPLTDCPSCGGTVRRVVNAVGVVFKGSGFYITDSRNGKNASLSTNGKTDSTSSTTETGKESAAQSKEKAAPAAKSSPSTAGSATAV